MIDPAQTGLAHFGRNLSQWRTWRGLSIRELGCRSKVSAQNISRLERGDTINPTLGTVYRLAEAVQVRADVLVRPNSFDEFQNRAKVLEREYGENHV